jgi:hypothetical protein
LTKLKEHIENVIDNHWEHVRKHMIIMMKTPKSKKLNPTPTMMYIDNYSYLFNI